MSSNKDFQITDQMVDDFFKTKGIPHGILYMAESISLIKDWEAFKASQSIVEGKRDWEIISFSNGGDHYTHSTDGLFRSPNDIYARRKSEFFDTLRGYSIHSVKRLSDSTIFSIGDKLIHNDGSYTTFIKEFTIPSGSPFDMWFYFEEDKSHVRDMKNFKKAPVPLFTTNDGKEIFEGDSFYEIDNGKWVAINTEYRHFATPIFSTKEAADQYIFMNRPCLSVNDAKTVYSKDRSFVGTQFLIDGLKSLAQSKTTTP